MISCFFSRPLKTIYLAPVANRRYREITAEFCRVLPHFPHFLRDRFETSSRNTPVFPKESGRSVGEMQEKIQENRQNPPYHLRYLFAKSTCFAKEVRTISEELANKAFFIFEVQTRQWAPTNAKQRQQTPRCEALFKTTKFEKTK